MFHPIKSDILILVLYQFLLVCDLVNPKWAKGQAISTTTSLRPSSAESSSTDCILPPHPKNGHWDVSSTEVLFKPGMSIESYKFLSISCAPNYKLSGDSVIVCINGKWSKEIGICEALCSPISNTYSRDVICSSSSNVFENCTEPVSGTTAKISCKPFYEDSHLQQESYLFCVNGQWNQNAPKCVPQCGRRNDELETLIINGREVQKGKYPWQVAIYLRKKSSKTLICGGSLIGERIVLTAAHCLTNVQNGQLQPKNNYIIGVGKLYREFDDSRDTEAQFSTVQEIFVPDLYSGESRQFAGDIAVVITHKSFKLSNVVQPACLNWALLNYGQEIENSQEAFAYVAGWGFQNETGNVSEILREIRVPSINSLDCIREFPEEDSRYFTRDKICAGYKNQSTAICVGDSGGGLVYQNKNNGRFYLLGIVSLAAKGNEKGLQGCNSQQYGLYTDIQKYIMNFVSGKVALYEDITHNQYFKCKSGEFIVKDQECNGAVDCQDASDETINCQNSRCPTGFARCKYGACIHPKNLCDKKQDCRDHSDEDEKTCKNSSNAQSISEDQQQPNRDAYNQECILPQHPVNGSWNIFGSGSSNISMKPGDSVILGTILTISCTKPYQLDGQSLIVCGNGVWGPTGVGRCIIPFCPAISSTETTVVSCVNINGQIINCTSASTGTKAQIKCADFYEVSVDVKTVNLTCVDGSWSDKIPNCKPICGLTNDSKQVYPWKVDIYKSAPSLVLDYIYFCRGALIGERLVLTSASCVTYANDGETSPINEFVVAFGKKLHDFSDPKEPTFQYTKLQELIVAPGYRGADTNLNKNIAVLVTEKRVVFSPNILPICLDKNESNTKIGYIYGWNTVAGSFKSSEIPPVEVLVPYIDQKSCAKNISEELKAFLFDDKFCSRSSPQDSECYSKNGEILATKNVDNGRYYAVGIMSEVVVFPYQSLIFSCRDPERTNLFTNISVYYEDFIQPQLLKYP